MDNLTNHPTFRKLRKWRKEKAYNLNVPEYTLLPDYQIKQLIDLVPLGIEDLSNIIPYEKIERFGNEILENCCTC